MSSTTKNRSSEFIIDEAEDSDSSSEHTDTGSDSEEVTDGSEEYDYEDPVYEATRMLRDTTEYGLKDTAIQRFIVIVTKLCTKLDSMQTLAEERERRENENAVRRENEISRKLEEMKQQMIAIANVVRSKQ